MRHLVLHIQPMNQQENNNRSKTSKVNLIKLSADVHKRDYKISRQIGDQNIQPTQVFEPEEAFEWAVKQLESAERVVFCYEAGFSGFSLARRLKQQGVESVVMCPQKLDERCKRVNTDKRDSRAIAGRLDRFLAGNEEALVKVRIPTEQEEDERAISRQRDQMMKGRKQFEAQGRSLSHVQRAGLSGQLVAGERSGLERNGAETSLAGWGGRTVGGLPAHGPGGGKGDCPAHTEDRKSSWGKSACEHAGAAEWLRGIEHGNFAARSL